jgi:thymidylate synthase
MTVIRHANVEYREMLKKILAFGNNRGDRTGTGTCGLFGEQMKFDLTKGFPLLTTKKLHWRSIAHELLWLISGSTNIKYLQDNGVTIWDEWADENGELGPVYGQQWRKWATYTEDTFYDGGDDPRYERWHHDQLKMVIERIIEKPEDRRLLVSAWNAAEISNMKLPPCHVLFQFYTRESDLGGRYLDCHMYQRSADVFLGVPFNIASYALLTHMVAHVTKTYPGILTISYGDIHIYQNHMDQVKEQISRDPFKYHLPTLKLNPEIRNIDSFKYEDIQLLGYDAFPSISAPVAV